MASSCHHDPRQYLGTPIGMYHCPECGEMVLAGMEHPDYDAPMDTEVYETVRENYEKRCEDTADDFPFEEGV